MWYKKEIKKLIKNYETDIENLKKEEPNHRYEEEAFLEGSRMKLENVVDDLKTLLNRVSY